MSLVREGAAVAVSSRSSSKLESAVAELNLAATSPVIGRVLDVMDSKAIVRVCDEVAETLGGLDVLVSNSGGPPAGTFDEVDEAGFVSAFNLLLGSAFRLTKAALPYLRGGGGAIVYITSSATKEVIPNLVLSNTMRSGVLGMAKTLSKEVAGDGVRVMCAAPGRIATDRVAELDRATALRRGTEPERVIADAVAAIPMGRYGEPEEFGDVVAFLVSDRASYVAGTTVLVDGGKLSTTTS
jgi:3-oxoacyl-[acyl-carrier protein] reductase